MVQIYDPARLTYPRLRECAYQAAWIATVAEAANDVEDLLIDVSPDERVLPDFGLSSVLEEAEVPAYAFAADGSRQRPMSAIAALGVARGAVPAFDMM